MQRIILLGLTLLAAVSLLGLCYLLFSHNPSLDRYLPVIAMLFGWSIVARCWLSAKIALQGDNPDNGTRWQRLKIKLAHKLVTLMTLLFFVASCFLFYVSIRVINFSL